MDRFFAAGAVVALVLLAFLNGAWTAWRDGTVFNSGLRQAFVGTRAVWGQYVAPKEPFGSDAWMPAPESGVGLKAHDEAAAFPGYTLLAAGQQAVLLDMAGRPVHRWHLPYRELTGDEAALGRGLPPSWIYWRPARLLPGGDLLVLVNAWENTPTGLALMRLDRDSNPRWVYHHHVHHDFDVDEDGRIYILDQTVRRERPAGLGGLREPMLDEGLVTLSPRGRELSRVSILDAFDNSKYREIINRNAEDNRRRWGDYMHNNNVDLVTERDAGNLPFLKKGQIILSMRQLNTLAALDLERKRIVWALRGAWHRQHDPDLLPNGHMLVFDNQGDWARAGQTRVIEVDPVSGGIVWAWPARGKGMLWSSYRGDSQRLPNGNVLVNEFARGRVLEVTRSGEVAWEYVTALRHPERPELVARIMSAERYARDDPALSWLKNEQAAARRR